jgi:penicillin amidase
MSILFRGLKLVIVLAVVIVVGFAGLGGYLFFRAMPHYSGHVEMAGLGTTVDVIRDNHGVPHIFATTMNDAMQALGYVHASERLFQMEMQRRAGQGRLAEILGPDMLGVDRFTRTLGLYRLAQSSVDALSPEARQLVDAYTAGVNAWLETHGNKLPPEFLVLGIKPEKWQPADSLVWSKLMAVQLSHNYKLEVLRAHLAEKLSPAEMNLLFPRMAADSPITTQPHTAQAGALTPDAAFDKLGEITDLRQGASNEWVIAGSRTESGKPILANDPHLGLEAPILWYLARIKTPDLDLVGATVPGLPVVLLGQNGHIAWGLTTTGSDVEDLFVETVDPQNPTQYMTPDGAKPFDMRSEIIHVKGGADVILNVRSTRHGPVLSDIDPELGAIAGNGKVMALSFTGLAEHDTTAEALMRINRAHDATEFMAALQLYQAPPQNFVYADTAGSIGFIAAGLVPMRKKGEGLVPADGASGDYDWSGMIPFVEEPQVANPAAGFVFNANNAVVPADASYFIGIDWEEPYRARRLQKFFDTIGKHSLETSAAMQADHVSVAATDLLPYLLMQKPIDAFDAGALELLRGWDGTMDKARPEPLIFDAWLDAMHRLLLVGKTGDAMKEKGPFDATAITAIVTGNSDWCRSADKAASSCDDVMRQGLHEALLFLRKRHGDDMKIWRWGDEHITMMRNKFYSHIPGFERFADFAVPASGDYYTLDRGGGSSDDAQYPFARTHAGGFRGLYDLADPTKSRFMIATGESGHIFSLHYRDLVMPWSDVKSFTLTGTQDELENQGLPELVFEPAQ